jgi:hypothetical protein
MSSIEELLKDIEKNIKELDELMEKIQRMKDGG